MSMQRIKLGLTLALLSFLIACEEDPATQVERGWQLFESGDFLEARSAFMNAAASGSTDAYNGLGWSYLRLDSISEARIAFAFASSDSNPEIYAGWSSANVLSEDFQKALEKSAVVLRQDANFVFSHDTDVDYKDMIWQRAYCYYHLGQYALSLQEIQKISPNFNSANPADILNKLESLSNEL